MTYLSTDQTHLPPFLSQPACACHVHQKINELHVLLYMYIKINNTQCHLVQGNKDIADFQKTILHALHSQSFLVFAQLV